MIPAREGAEHGEQGADQCTKEGEDGDQGRCLSPYFGGCCAENISGSRGALAQADATQTIASKEEPTITGNGHDEKSIPGPEGIEQEQLFGGTAALPEAEHGVKQDGHQGAYKGTDGIEKDIISGRPMAEIEIKHSDGSTTGVRSHHGHQMEIYKPNRWRNARKDRSFRSLDFSRDLGIMFNIRLKQ